MRRAGSRGAADQFVARIAMAHRMRQFSSQVGRLRSELRPAEGAPALQFRARFWGAGGGLVDTRLLG